MRCKAFVAAAVAAASTSTSAFADPKFEFTKADDVKDVDEVEWTAAAELGLVFTTGNSDTTTASAGLRATRKTGNNKLSFEGSLTYARSSLFVLRDLDGNGTVDSEDEITTQSLTTAETLASKLRYDRFLTEHNSLFVAALASRDVPAGKESVFGGQLGYSRQIYKSKLAESVAELGYDYAREDLVAGDPVSIHSVRAFVGHHAQMTEGTTLDASIEALSNVLEVDLPTGEDGGPGQDTRFNLKIAISSKLNASLAIQTSIEAKYDHRPAPLAIANLAPGFVPEAAPLDTIMKASLIYTFLTPKKPAEKK